MKIVYITRSFPFEKGETFLCTELRFLRKKGHEILIFPCGPAKKIVNRDAEEFLNSARVIFLKRFSALVTVFKNFFLHPLIYLRFFIFILRSKSYHQFITRVRTFAKAIVAAEVSKRWGANHIHAYWASEPATMAFFMSELTGIPFSFTAHRIDILVNEMLNLKFRKASFIRFVSEDGMILAKEVTGTSPGENARVIHLGVELPESIQAKNEGSKEIILCPANLVEVKGHRYLLQAMSILKDRKINLKLWLAGDGPLREQLESLADKLQLSDRVKFLGHVSHDELLKLYERRDILCTVLASVDLGKGEREGGLSIALMEAMSYGVPVVATRVGGIPELVTEGTGILVKDKDPEALADAIEKIYRDESLRTDIGKAARERIEKYFSIENTASEVLKLFATYSSVR